jgi:hypothetical protein
MKTQKANVVAMSVAAILVVYTTAPIIAGAKRFGEREGPALYPEELHTALYIIGHETAFHEKPRQSLDTWMYHRPWFYGQPRRLKSISAREAYIAKARMNQSPRLDWLIEMNNTVNQGTHVHPPRLATPRH